MAVRTARVVGTGVTPLGKLGRSATSLMEEALQKALGSSGLEVRDLDGLVAVPSLSEPRFMEAHYLATRVGLLPRKGVLARTLDTGGAGPVSGLLLAARMVKEERCRAVAVVAGDAVASMDTAEFLRRADSSVLDASDPLPSPCIPHGYGRVAEWQMDTYGVTREQLAMVPVLMSRQAARHPLALSQEPVSLAEVMSSRPIAPATNLMECARRADGAAAIIVADSDFMDQQLGHDRVSSSTGVPSAALGPASRGGGAVILGGGEASGPLYPPPVIDESMFSCEHAARTAYAQSQLLPSDIDWFGLYDCYPICFIRAVEAMGLAPKGRGGSWVEEAYNMTAAEPDYAPSRLPVNTHGGLMAFGAPWEVPAMYNVIEAVEQLAGRAGGRQVPGARRALVYGNGGIFSHSAVVILAAPVD